MVERQGPGFVSTSPSSLRRSFLILAVFLFAAGVARTAAAEPQMEHIGAQLAIAPRRLVLAADQPSATVVLGVATGRSTYDISFVDRLMLPQGQIVSLDEAPRSSEVAAITARLRSAQPFVSADAVRIAIEAHSTAEVRVRLRAPPSSPGEYRTHLTFTALPPDAPAGARAGPTMIWVHTIPVIVRVGAVDVRAAIENLTVQDLRPEHRTTAPDQRLLAFDLVRRGGNSLFGDVGVRTRDGRIVILVQGIAVYPELERRRITLPVSLALGRSVELLFLDRDTRPGQILARARVRLATSAVAGLGAGAGDGTRGSASPPLGSSSSRRSAATPQADVPEA